MAKKTNDLKITDEELKLIQEKVQEINNLQMQVGGLEIQKQMGVAQVNQAQVQLGELQKTLEEKYGKVSVNLTDGTIKEIEEDEPNKPSDRSVISFLLSLSLICYLFKSSGLITIDLPLIERNSLNLSVVFILFLIDFFLFV